MRMDGELELFDVTIVGGGPAGMYAAFYSGMRALRTKLIEARPRLGGRMHTYPEKIVWDVGGLGPTVCADLIAQLERQARTFEPDIRLGEEIADIGRLPDGTFLLTSAAGTRHWTRTVILAMGSGILRPTKLDIAGADRFEVSNLHYTVQRIEKFRDRRVVISGGGDSAVDWANALAGVAAKVTLVHRREQFGAYEHGVLRMRESGVDIRTPYAIRELRSGDGATIDSVFIVHMETGASEWLETDEVLVNHGVQRSLGSLERWGVRVEGKSVPVGDRMETNVPGLFAAGDLADYANKLYLIAAAFTDAAAALNGAKSFLDPAAPLAADVSSHNDRFDSRNRELASGLRERI